MYEMLIVPLLTSTVYDLVKALFPDWKERVDKARLEKRARKLVSKSLLEIFTAYGRFHGKAEDKLKKHKDKLQKSLCECVMSMQKGEGYRLELNGVSDLLIEIGFDQYSAKLAAKELLSVFVTLMCGSFDPRTVLQHKEIKEKLDVFWSELSRIISDIENDLVLIRQEVASIKDGNEKILSNQSQMLCMLEKLLSIATSNFAPPSPVKLRSYCYNLADYLKNNWQKLPLLEDKIPLPLSTELRVWETVLPRSGNYPGDERNEAFFEKSFPLDDGVSAAVFEALGGSKVCYLFADPGAGKSTYMKWLAMEYALLFAFDESTHVPIYIDLGSLNISDSVEEYLAQTKAGKLSDSTGKTKVIWFFDGLDLFSDKGKISDLFSAHLNCGCEDRYVFSSRSNYGFEQGLIFPAHCVYLHPLSKEQRREFVAKRLEPEIRKKYDSFAKNGNATEKLTEIPLLFAMSLLALRDAPEFPKGRFPMKAGIFDSFVSYVVERRTEIGKQEVLRKCRTIMDIAPVVFYSAFMGVDGRSYEDRLPFDFLEDLLDGLGGENLRKWDCAVQILIDTGLIQSQENEYRILHQQFAEHFAARHVAKELDEAWRVGEDCFKKSFWKYFCQKRNDAVLEQALSMMRKHRNKPENVAGIFSDDLCTYELFARAYGKGLCEYYTDVLRDASNQIAKRELAGWVLGDIACESAVDDLLDALRVRELRHCASGSLGKIGGDKVESGLQVLMDDEDPDVKRCAYLIEADIKRDKTEDSPHAITDSQVKGSRNSNPIIRIEGDIRDSWVLDDLLVKLKDKDKSVREMAADCLGQKGDPRAVTALLEALKDVQATVRSCAAFALGDIGDPRAVKALIEALEDVDESVRGNAAYALGRIGDRRAVPGLLIALETGGKSIKREVAWALGRIGDQRAEDGLLLVLKDEDEEVRKSAVVALGILGCREAVGPVIQLLRENDKWMKNKVSHALMAISSLSGFSLILVVRLIVFVHGIEMMRELAYWFSFRIPPTSDLIPDYTEFVEKHYDILERFKNGEEVDLLPLLR